MRIYFAASIRGGRGDVALYGQLIDHLKKYGEVLTEHVGSPLITAVGEQGLTEKQIHDRDLEWLLSSDAFVAEVTTPSLGVGYEARCAVERQIPALCLAKTNTLVSAMLLGSDWLKTRFYSSEGAALAHIDSFFLSLQQT